MANQGCYPKDRESNANSDGNEINGNSSLRIQYTYTFLHVRMIRSMGLYRDTTSIMANEMEHEVETRGL